MMNSVSPDSGKFSQLCVLSVMNLKKLSFSFRSSKQSGSSGSSSIGIIRTDSSDVFDGTFDGDSRGSSVSLNSTCSSRSHQDPNFTASSNGLHDDSNANG
jgi:hypothetical protein